MKKSLILIVILLTLGACDEKNPTSQGVESKNEILSFEANESYKPLALSIDHLLKENSFNGVALVANGDNIILNQGYGEANTEAEIANTSQTQFHIASVSKSFVAVSILQLVEQGKLALDDKISDFFDIPRGEFMTIHHLLTHTSSLYDVTTYEGYEALTTVEMLIAPAFEEENTYFDTIGEESIYANIGYDLLGAIVEKVSKLPYDQYIEENIFKPLKMDNSMLNVENNTIDNLATPYTGDISENNPALMMHPSFGYASGGLHSTVEDLYRYDRALSNYDLITKESYDLMVTPHSSVNGHNYGYGWFVDNDGTISHPGNLLGWHSMLLRHIDDEVTVILLTNHDESDMNVAHIIAKLVLANVENNNLLIP